MAIYGSQGGDILIVSLFSLLNNLHIIGGLLLLVRGTVLFFGYFFGFHSFFPTFNRALSYGIEEWRAVAGCGTLRWRQVAADENFPLKFPQLRNLVFD